MSQQQKTYPFPFQRDWATPPGDTLAEALEIHGYTQAELALRTGISKKHINQIIRASAPLTPETALRLEKATLTSAATWNGLEANYRGHLARQQEQGELAGEVPWLRELPVAEMVKRGWIAKHRKKADQLREVLCFFGVADRSAREAVWRQHAAYRRSPAFAGNPGAATAWLRHGEVQARKAWLDPFDRSLFREALKELRGATRLTPPDWASALVSTCAAAGVVVVIEPQIKGARINSAVRWFTPDKALIQLSGQRCRVDEFWLAFFRSAGHLLLHGKRERFIDADGDHEDLLVQEADAFAARTLIPREHEAELAELNSAAEIQAFAETIGIHPGIVAGRLQRERDQHSRWTSLIQRLEFPSQPQGDPVGERA